MKKSIILKVLIILINLSIIPLISFNPYVTENEYEAKIISYVDAPNTNNVVVILELQPDKMVYVTEYYTYQRPVLENDTYVTIDARMIDINPTKRLIFIYVILPMIYILLVLLFDIYLIFKFIKKNNCPKSKKCVIIKLAKRFTQQNKILIILRK